MPGSPTITTERVVPLVSTMRCRLLNEPPEVRSASNVSATGGRSPECFWERRNFVGGVMAPGS